MQCNLLIVLLILSLTVKSQQSNKQYFFVNLSPALTKISNKDFINHKNSQWKPAKGFVFGYSFQLAFAQPVYSATNRTLSVYSGFGLSFTKNYLQQINTQTRLTLIKNSLFIPVTITYHRSLNTRLDFFYEAGGYMATPLKHTIGQDVYHYFLKQYYSAAILGAGFQKKYASHNISFGIRLSNEVFTLSKSELYVRNGSLSFACNVIF